MKSNKVVVNLAPTGVIPTKSMTSHVPVTPQEVALDIANCSKLGLTCVHNSYKILICGLN